MTDSQIDLLLNFSIAATPGGIEQQEAQGQKNLIQSTTLPIKGNWEVLERWGVIRGEPIDKLFCHCTLPEGWTKTPTDHSMWSSLVDARGLIRANIFYKAAFYDKDAHIHAVQRFSIAGVYEDTEDCQHGRQYKVYDNALSHAVFIDTPVRSGEHKGVLVAVKDDRVYVRQRDFLQPVHWKSNEVTLLGDHEFYDKWHNRKTTQHEFLDAIDNLAQFECQKYIAQLPTDDSIWEPVFDFPEVL